MPVRWPPEENRMNEKITTSQVVVALAWAFVGLPLAWGVIMTLKSAMALFA